MNVGINNRKIKWRSPEYVIIKHQGPPAQPTGQRGVKEEITTNKQKTL